MRIALVLLSCLAYVFALHPQVPGEVFLPHYEPRNEKLTAIWKAHKLLDLQNKIDRKEIPVVQPLYDSSLIEACQKGNPIFLETEDRQLPANNRQNGDPCKNPNDCASGYCVCQPTGGQECSAQPLPPSLQLTYESWSSTFQTPSGVTSAQLLAQVNDPTSGYCRLNPPDFSNFGNHVICSGGSTTNIGQMMTLEWYQPCDQVGSFRIGVDWGRGGGIIVDGNLETAFSQDAWWTWNWGSGSPAVMVVSERVWARGYHKIQFIGSEGCCDGGGAIQYKNSIGSWMTVDQAFCFGPC